MAIYDKTKQYEDRHYEINDMPSALHFYYLNDALLTGNETDPQHQVTPRIRCADPITHSGQVLSHLWVPFMDESYLTLYKYNYDQVHYGTTSTNPQDTNNVPGVFVYKIMGTQGGSVGPAPGPFIDYQLKTLDKYPYGKFKQSRKRHWSNESKLFQFPYHYVTINDYMNAPLQLQMHMIEGDKYKNNKQYAVNVRQAISANGTYTLYVPGCKGDVTGALEGMKAVSPMDLPTGSSQYSQMMANSKAQWANQNMMAIANAAIGTSGRVQAQYNQLTNAWADYKLPDQTIYQNITGGKNGGGQQMIKRIDNSAARASGRKQLIGAGLDIGVEVAGRVVNTFGAINGALARESDLISAPRNVTLQGGDVMDAITNGKRKVEAIRYHLQEEYLQRLGDYFAQYGYRQNKMMKIDLRSRRDYNYIRTIGANITGNGVPKKHLATIQSIFDNGTTLWHMDRNGGKFMDYSDDNVEV